MAIDVEKILRPVDNPIPPFPPKYMMLAGGEEMVIRQVSREDIPDILCHVEPLLHVERDYYDVVAARLISELLAYYRYRVQDEYVLVAQINGELVAVVNGRLLNKDVGMSYHTVALRRGLRVGAHAFAAKMEYHLDIIGQKEVLIVAESPIGFRRWMIEYELGEALQHGARAGRRAVLGADQGAVQQGPRDAGGRPAAGAQASAGEGAGGDPAPDRPAQGARRSAGRHAFAV